VPLVVDRRVGDDVRQAGSQVGVEEVDADGRVAVLVPVLVRGLGAVEGRRRVVPGGVVDEVGRVGGEQVRLLAVHQPRERLGAGRVAAEQPVVAEQPQIAEPGDGLLRRILGAGVVDLGIGQCGQEANAVERVLGAQRLERALAANDRELRYDGSARALVLRSPGAVDRLSPESFLALLERLGPRPASARSGRRCAASSACGSPPPTSRRSCAPRETITD
jgi:hypothetical protein